MTASVDLTSKKKRKAPSLTLVSILLFNIILEKNISTHPDIKAKKMSLLDSLL